MNFETLKGTIQDCNLNLLLGSGLSCPFLTTLGKIETLLTELDGADVNAEQRKLIRASLYRQYFIDVIEKNLKILAGDADAAPVLQQYTKFLESWNSILLKRKVTLLGKELNIFTTNVDVFLEKSLEDLDLEFNDGFNGRFSPKFSLSNYKKSRFKKSLYFDKSAELPVFNLLKVHGSLSWTLLSDKVVFSSALAQVSDVSSKVPPSANLGTVTPATELGMLVAECATKTCDRSIEEFLDAYDKLLLIVNPTKDKFKHTLLNQTYYEMLRLYSNELEKENTVLFVMGFSFADEHIREITLRAANSNPTLIVYVFAYTNKAAGELEEKLQLAGLKNKNIKIVAPDQQTTAGATPVDKFKFDLSELNERFLSALLKSLE